MWVRKKEGEIRWRDIPIFMAASFTTTAAIVWYAISHNPSLVATTTLKQWLWSIGIGAVQAIITGICTFCLKTISDALPLYEHTDDTSAKTSTQTQ